MTARLQRHMDRLVALGCPREEVASVDPHKLRTLAAALTSFATELERGPATDTAPESVTGPAVTCPAGPGATNPRSAR